MQVTRRVEELKAAMEKKMLDELEQQKQAELKARLEKQVGRSVKCLTFTSVLYYKTKLIVLAI